MKKQIAINLTATDQGGVSPTVIWGIHRSSVRNTLPICRTDQHYCAVLLIDEKADKH